MPEVGLEYYHPKVFSERHKIVVALKALGWKNPDICREVGLEPATVSKILGDPRAKVLRKQINEQYIEETVTDTQEKIQAHTLEAFDTVLGLMRGSKLDRVRQTSAFDILDRGGFKPKEQIITAKFNISPEDSRALLEVLLESKKEPEPLEMIQDSSGVFKAEDDITSARK